MTMFDSGPPPLSLTPSVDDELVDLLPATKLSRDLRRTASMLTPEQARYIVDLYYQLQEHRIATSNQARSLRRGAEPVELIAWFAGQLRGLEAAVPGVMEVWAEQSVPGRWLLAQHGIGPVLAAGFLAHLDVTKAHSAASYWRFAGLDPTSKWLKGQKRPWNADLKVLCWKAGDSFVKQSGNDKCFYGKVYRARKVFELAQDEAGLLAETAARTLSEKTFKDRKVKAIYESGHLPPGRLDLRARRHAVKLFLSHLYRVMYEAHHGAEPAAPYAIELLGHSHYIAPPLWPLAA